jgi:glycosyltransferase involved in cell wall biosynthesis
MYLSTAPTLLYVTPGFGIGGAEVRTAQIISFLGNRFRHRIASLNGNREAGGRINSAVPVDWVELQRNGSSFTMVSRFVRFLWAHRPDLVLTFNWGSIDAALATVLTGICPLIHTEDGLNIDEAAQQKRRRVIYRSMVLPHAYKIVAPSRNLAAIMRDTWRLPQDKICYLPNGVDTEKFHPRRTELPTDRVVVGTVGSLTAVKRQDLLIEISAGLKHLLPLNLRLVGDGPERARLEQQVEELGLKPHTVFCGRQQDTSAMYPHFDIFALTSSTEQMPLALLEAMASGLPVVSTDVGDVKRTVSTANQPYIVRTMTEFRTALLTLAAQPALRRSIGQANRDRCLADFSSQRMYESYAALYTRAIRSQFKQSVASL